MIDLDRVQQYINLGFEKEDAIKRVEKEMKEEEKKNIKATEETEETEKAPNMDDYIKKDELEEIVQKRMEEENLKKKEIDPPEEKPDLGTLMSRFF